MAVRRARKLCPDLLLIPPNPRLYARASRALHEILRIYAPVIEPQGYGHAFLDLSGTERLFGPAGEGSERIRREAASRLSLPLTVGVAGNKLVSEAATRAGRGGQADRRTGGQGCCPSVRLSNRPSDIWPLLVPAGSEAPFLAPHPMAVLPGVPDDILFRLDEYQLERIGQVAAIAEGELCAVFGGRGRLLSSRSRGIDARPVLSPAVKAEFRLSHTLATDTNDRSTLHALLRRLTEGLGRRLRRRGLGANRLTVQVEYADYKSSEQSRPLGAHSLDADLWEAARRALDAAMDRRIAVRTVTVTADRLVEANAQIDLWDVPDRPAEVRKELQRAIDRIHALSTGRSATSWKRPPHHTRTIFPTESFRSMAACAAATSAIGNTA